MKRLLIVIGLFVFYVPVALLDGWVLTKLWSWFIVPTFDLPLLSLPAAIGLGVVIDFVTLRRQPTVKDEELSEFITSSMAFSIFKPLALLVIGSIVKLWM